MIIRWMSEGFDAGTGSKGGTFVPTVELTAINERRDRRPLLAYMGYDVGRDQPSGRSDALLSALAGLGGCSCGRRSLGFRIGGLRRFLSRYHSLRWAAPGVHSLRSGCVLSSF
jgi:hypothetical protein